MTPRRDFYFAPWGGWQILRSICCLGPASAATYLAIKKGTLMVPVLLALLLVVSVFQTIWGYSIEDGVLVIHRLGWKTRISLADLESVRRDACLAIKDELKWGNTPYCSALMLTTLQSTPHLGKYDAYLNGHKNAIVLTFPSRKIVVSPNDPEGFAVALKRTVPTA